jgi:hypothetical protein
VLVIEAEQHSAEIEQQDLGAITVHCSTVAARETDRWLAQAAQPWITRDRARPGRGRMPYRCCIER